MLNATRQYQYYMQHYRSLLQRARAHVGTKRRLHELLNGAAEMRQAALYARQYMNKGL